MKHLISPLFISSHSRTPSGRVRGEPPASVGSFTLTSVLAWALAGLCAVGSVGVFAEGKAVGDIDSGFIEGVPDNKKEGTSNFFVYSEQMKPVAAGPNAAMTHGVVDKDNNIVDQVPVPIEQEKIKVAANKEYGPPRGAVKNRKKLEQGKHRAEQLNSGSGGGLINDNVTASAAYMFDKNNPIIVASAQARKALADGTKIEGKAAAKVTDPVLLPPESYTYTPHLNVTLERDQDNDFATVEFFASDSAGPLWTLTITADGLLSSDVSINFQLKREHGLIDSAGQPLDPAQIAESLLQALVMTPSGASLSDYELFPSDTQYVVDTETYYEFGTGAAFESSVDLAPIEKCTETPDTICEPFVITTSSTNNAAYSQDDLLLSPAIEETKEQQMLRLAKELEDLKFEKTVLEGKLERFKKLLQTVQDRLDELDKGNPADPAIAKEKATQTGYITQLYEQIDEVQTQIDQMKIRISNIEKELKELK